jgi:glyoxylase-like metal-dependent hydrolase (beta-lactamase superfamily II)
VTGGARARQDALAALAEVGAAAVAPDIWRWTAFHPQWREQVASVAVVGDRELVLIDPLIPRAAASFWPRLDEALHERALALGVVLTVFWHRRSACEIAARYGDRATVWVHEQDRGRVGCPVTRPFRPGGRLPGGVVAFATARGGEVVLWLPRARTLITGDVLLGGKRKPLRICPNSWLRAGVTRHDVARSLEHLVDLRVDRVLCSHGEPVLDQAQLLLAAAIQDA